MKDRTHESQRNPWPNFTEKTGGQFVTERTGWFVFKRTKTKVVVPMGFHTMTLYSSDSDSVGSPWWEFYWASGDDVGSYDVTCMTVPYRSPKALTFKIFPSRHVKTGDPAFDDLRIKGTGRDSELTEQLFLDADVRKMVSRYLGPRHASPWVVKKGYYRASNHGWAWMESKKVKKFGDETLNELRLVYRGELEDTELLLGFHQLLTKTMESLRVIGCVVESPIYE